MPNQSNSYPGGKSGAGIFQRLINLIPPHRVLIVPFAGHCGVVRNIRPAEHTIVIDQDPAVCEWWDNWRRSKQGRDLEIHHCDGIEFLRYRLGTTEYFVGGTRDAGSRDTRATTEIASEAFVFCDPPYVLSERSSGKLYECELTDHDHERLLGTVTRIDAAKYSVMICGYDSPIYASLDPWNAIAHRVPTRGGLQDERIWMNYTKPVRLHDYRYIGSDNRSRERIRRRQKNWHKQLKRMPEQERQAMLQVLNSF